MHIFAKPLISGLTEDIWIIISTSAFNLVQYVGLLQEYERTPDSHKYVVEKGGIVLIVFSDNYRYSLILHKNTSSYFSKVSCMWNLKLHQQSFHSSPLKSIDLCCTLNGLSAHGFITSDIGYLNILVH